MSSLLFVYDEMLMSSTRELSRVNMKFISYAFIKGQLFWFNDTKKKRLFAYNNISGKNSVIYGAIFVINDFEKESLQLHSFYVSSIPYTNKIMQEDFYVLEKVACNPISFKKISDIERCRYDIGKPIECLCFMGNTTNPRIKRSLNNRRYYGHKAVDTKSYIYLIKENERKKNYELE